MLRSSVEFGDMSKSFSCIPVAGRGAIAPFTLPRLDPININLYNVLLVVPDAS